MGLFSRGYFVGGLFCGRTILTGYFVLDYFYGKPTELPCKVTCYKSPELPCLLNCLVK